MSHREVGFDVPVSMSTEARLWWMAEFSLCDERLAAPRLAWLMLQSILHPNRKCRPMPGDSQPSFWPSYALTSATPDRNSPDESFINRLKRSYRVEDVASRLTELWGHGDLLTGKCPLHSERKGRAFAIWTESQRWRCFGKCGIGGDVIDLVRECRERGIEWR